MASQDYGQLHYRSTTRYFHNFHSGAAEYLVGLAIPKQHKSRELTAEERINDCQLHTCRVLPLELEDRQYWGRYYGGGEMPPFRDYLSKRVDDLQKTKDTLLAYSYQDVPLTPCMTTGSGPFVKTWDVVHCGVIEEPDYPQVVPICDTAVREITRSGTIDKDVSWAPKAMALLTQTTKIKFTPCIEDQIKHERGVYHRNILPGGVLNLTSLDDMVKIEAFFQKIVEMHVNA